MAWFQKYKHGLLLLYFLIYLPWFQYLEKKVTVHFNVIHMAIDDYIPFIEFFVIPYFLWFFYIAFAMAYFFLHSTTDWYKLCAFLFFRGSAPIVLLVMLLDSRRSGNRGQHNRKVILCGCKQQGQHLENVLARLLVYVLKRA